MKKQSYLFVCNADKLDMPVCVIFVYVYVPGTEFFIPILGVGIPYRLGYSLFLTAVKNPGL